MQEEKLINTRKEEIEKIEQIGKKYKDYYLMVLILIPLLLFFYFDKNLNVLFIGMMISLIINVYIRYYTLLIKQNRILRFLKEEEVKNPIREVLER
jgi:uncharacterized membrane protein